MNGASAVTAQSLFKLWLFCLLLTQLQGTLLPNEVGMFSTLFDCPSCAWISHVSCPTLPRNVHQATNNCWHHSSWIRICCHPHLHRADNCIEVETVVSWCTHWTWDHDIWRQWSVISTASVPHGELNKWPHQGWAFSPVPAKFTLFKGCLHFKMGLVRRNALFDGSSLHSMHVALEQVRMASWFCICPLPSPFVLGDAQQHLAKPVTRHVNWKNPLLCLDTHSTCPLHLGKQKESLLHVLKCSTPCSKKPVSPLQARPDKQQDKGWPHTS